MTNDQTTAIDKMDESQLRNTISIISAGSNEHKEAIIEYCESKLDGLNVNSALVIPADVSDAGIIND